MGLEAVEYYDDGYTPEDAVGEELSYWD